MRIRHPLTIALGFAASVLAGSWWAAGPASSETRQPQGESALPDHPLVTGRLSGEARQQRFRAFVRAERASAPGEDQRGLYRAFLEDTGVALLGGYLEDRYPFCHNVAHDLGRVVAERAGDLRLAMAVCGDTCSYGCVHGVFKTHFLKEWEIDEGAHAHGEHDQAAAPQDPAKIQIDRMRQQVNDVCRGEFTVVKDFFRGNCAHSIGHAFGGLGRHDAKVAVGYCAAFDEIEMRYYCETGVFMELAETIKSELYQGKPSFEEQRQAGMDYCLETSGLPGACMRFVLLFNRDMRDVERMAERCLTLEGRRRRGCFNTLGFLSRGLAVSRRAQLGQVCRHGDPTDRTLCVSGAAFATKVNRARERLQRACQALADADLKAVCDEQEGRSYYQVDNPVFNRMFAEPPVPTVPRR